MLAAALCYLQIGIPSRSGQHPLLRHCRIDLVLHLLHSHHAVYLRDLLWYLVAIALRHTSDHDQLLQMPGMLVLCHTQQRLHALLLRIEYEAAGIDYDDISVLLVIRELIPVSEKSHHHLGIDQIFVTSEGYHT